MTGGGKQGQLGQGRAVDSCTEPKIVHLAGGTVQKVRVDPLAHGPRVLLRTKAQLVKVCVSYRLASRSLRSSHSSYGSPLLPNSYVSDQSYLMINGIFVHSLFQLLSISF